MTYYILQDGTTEKKAGNCLLDLIIVTIFLIAIGITIGRKTMHRKEN